jgi:predicted nucleic acid-binding protein
MSDSTSSIPLYVIDASVAAKWLLPDEPDADLAVAILTEFREGRTALVAPNQIRYEVPSAIRNAFRTKRLTQQAGRAAISKFLSWQVPTVDDAMLIEAGYDQAVRFGCSFYDGLYLALAETLDCPFVFADQRLRNGLGTSFPRALWLSDYLPSDRPTAG